MSAALRALARLVNSFPDSGVGRRVAQVPVPRRFGLSGDDVAHVPVYGGRVAFGVDPVVSGRLGRVEELPRNPFAALGVRPGSARGGALTDDYVSAVGAVEGRGGVGTDVDALLYMMGRGVDGASDMFGGLARAGQRVPFGALGRPASADLSGLVLVHGTDFVPRRAGSDVLLSPTGDFRSSTGGRSLMDYVNDYNAGGRSADRNIFYPWRNSVHFSVNHRVAPVVGMGQQFDWSGKPHWIFSNLEDVVDANPGALANLNRYDTFFVPGAGSPLRLPNATVMDLPASQGTRRVPVTDRSGISSEVPMADREYMDYLVRQEIQGRGGQMFPDAPESLIGNRGAIGDADRRLDALARELNVPMGRHFESPYYYSETNPYDLLYNMGRGEFLPDFIPRSYAPTVSRNLYERILAGNRLSGVAYEPYNPWVGSGL